jgi:hypothetical protein
LAGTAERKRLTKSGTNTHYELEPKELAAMFKVDTSADRASPACAVLTYEILTYPLNGFATVGARGDSILINIKDKRSATTLEVRATSRGGVQATLELTVSVDTATDTAEPCYLSVSPDTGRIGVAKGSKKQAILEALREAFTFGSSSEACEPNLFGKYDEAGERVAAD